MVVEPIAVMPGDDAAAEEAWFSGTHLGTYHGLSPTGRSVRVRVCGIYLFDEDRLICERVYYDLLTVLLISVSHTHRMPRRRDSPCWQATRST
jgi:hypothetical protein